MKAITILLTFIQSVTLFAQQRDEVGISPWGKDDEIGTLNMMTDESRLAILSRIRSGKKL